MLNSAFITEFSKIANHQWRINIETSLNASTHLLESILPCISHYYIDVKDMNPQIYNAYTTGFNGIVKRNLQLLASKVSPDNVTIRLPHIPGFNNESDILESEKKLKQMGFVNFDTFEYVKTSSNR